jgi:RNA polymerase sigma factor (sigma-70 family)
LRTSALREESGTTDGQLLEAFRQQHSEAAFAALAWRHGPMVWGVCHRLLRSHQDAEDAFQATFLVLVQKAMTIRDQELVGNWLYGVAQQTAVRMRALAARRGVRERQVTELPEPAVSDPDLWHDLRSVLDEELSRLPEKYRVLVVLCDLVGKTRQEVAQQLDIPEGTVAGRLARARKMLAARLARRGVIVSGGLLATLLVQQTASAAVPTGVISATLKAVTLVATGAGAISAQVVALTEGVVKSMLLLKLKTAGAVLVMVLGLVALGGGLATRQTEAAPQTGENIAKSKAAQVQVAAPPKAAKPD